VEQHLARGTIEVIGAARDVDSMVTLSESATESEVAKATNLPVEVDHRVAPQSVMSLSADAPVTPHPVAAVAWIKKLVLEAELVMSHPLA